MIVLFKPSFKYRPDTTLQDFFKSAENELEQLPTSSIDRLRYTELKKTSTGGRIAMEAMVLGRRSLSRGGRIAMLGVAGAPLMTIAQFARLEVEDLVDMGGEVLEIVSVMEEVDGDIELNQGRAVILASLD